MILLWQTEKLDRLNDHWMLSAFLFYSNNRYYKKKSLKWKIKTSKLILGLCSSRSPQTKVLHHLIFNLKSFIFKSATIRYHYQPFIMSQRKHFLQRKESSACMEKVKENELIWGRCNKNKCPLLVYLSPDGTPKLCSGGINFMSPVPERSAVTLAQF